MSFRPRLSFRGRLMLAVLATAVLPMVLLGFWTTRTAARSGEGLLESQLNAALDRASGDVERRWSSVRADLLMLAESEPAARALAGPTSGTADPPPYVRETFANIRGVEEVDVRDRTGLMRWHLGGPPPGPAISGGSEGLTVRVTLPVHDLLTEGVLGTISARVRATALFPPSGAVEPGGIILGASLSNGLTLLPPTVDERLFRATGAEWNGHRWLVVRRPVEGTEITAMAAGPLDLYTAPFERTARRAALAMSLAAIVILFAVVFVTRTLTTELERVVLAAEAVTGGDLERRLPVRTTDEVGRLARAFNGMTESLTRTMRTLSEKEALAAVGEFASELAHEIRNPLQSLRLDLQRLDEVATDATAVRSIRERVLRQIDRLDRAVTGALRVGRSGPRASRTVELREILEGARQGAAAEFAHRRVDLAVELPREDVRVEGDGDALEQLFLNLLLNAAQATPAGGAANVGVHTEEKGVRVDVADSGVGMSTESSVSTKRNGAGLGLKIARRIVATHAGRMEIESQLGRGTVVRVWFPRL